MLPAATMAEPTIPAEFTHVALHRMERGGCGDAAFYVKGPIGKVEPDRVSAKDGSKIAADSPVVCTSCGEAVTWSSLSLEVKPRS
jgi:hypothetical protein